jgi:hypothetical protein
LTPRLQFSLEAQAIKEGLLGREEYAMGKIHPVPPNYGQQEFDRRILPYLSIFPTVSMSRSDFVLDKLKGTGLGINLYEPHILSFGFLQDTMEPEDFERLMKMSAANAFEIFRAQSKQLSAIVEGSLVSESDHDLRYTCRRIFINIAAFLSGFYSDETGLRPFFKDFGYEEVLAEMSGVPVSVINTHYFGEWLDKVDDLFVRLLISLFLSQYQDEHVSVGRW